MIKDFFLSFYTKIIVKSRYFYTALLRKRIKNTECTIISSDCTGGLIYHQLNFQFKSPTINLFIEPLEFCYFCNNLKSYIDAKLCFYNDDKGYPVGVIHPYNLPIVKVHFLHYANFYEAQQAWERRKSRINYDNIFVILDYCNKENLTDELINSFNNIIYKKVFVYYRSNIDYKRIHREITDSKCICNGVSHIRKYHSLEINQLDFVGMINNVNINISN